MPGSLKSLTRRSDSPLAMELARLSEERLLLNSAVLRRRTGTGPVKSGLGGPKWPGSKTLVTENKKNTCDSEHDHIVYPLNVLGVNLEISGLSAFFADSCSLFSRLFVTIQLFPCQYYFVIKNRGSQSCQLNLIRGQKSFLLNFCIFSFDFFCSLSTTLLDFFKIGVNIPEMKFTVKTMMLWIVFC